MKTKAPPMTSKALDLIGNTPLVKVSRIDTGKCELFLKLECQNPGGSIKDRIGLSMIAAAEREGKIKKGSMLVEATAGNTGLGLAIVAAQKGYSLTLVIPDKMAQEKILHLKALGAEVVLTRSDVDHHHPEYYQNLAKKIASEIPGSYFVDQFNNPANPKAHEESTGPEIFDQMNGDVDAIVCGVGSGGTIAGLTHYFAKVSPKTEMVLADPKGSALKSYVETGTLIPGGPYLVEGIGMDSPPSIADFSKCKKAYAITDAESFQAARELLRAEGIIGGSSSGTLLAAALKYCRESQTPKRVVVFICDTGNKYLSKMYNDYWMTDHGFMPRKNYGDLRDLVTRRYSDDNVISVRPDHQISTAYSRMRVYEFSQLPVIENGQVIGLIDESDILMAIEEKKAAFTDLVREHMCKDLIRVHPKTSKKELMDIFDRGMVGILYVENQFYGLITRTDLLNDLRHRVG